MQRQCPGCPNSLSKFSLRGYKFYSCPDHGLLVPAAAIKPLFKNQDLAEDCIRQLRPPRSALESCHKKCPECRRDFSRFKAHGVSYFAIEVCLSCKVYWFDQGEWEALSMGGFYPSLPHEAAVKGASIAPPSADTDWLRVEPANNWASALLPFEESHNLKSRPPILTVMICVFSFFATVLAKSRPALFEKWAYYPDQIFGHLGFSHITSMAVHVGLWHWFSNAVFLWIAGDDVEDEVGHLEFIKIFVLSGVAGHLLYTYSGGTVPSVGMSGAVAGIIAYYGIGFPNHRISKIFFVRRFGSLLGRPVQLSISAAAFVLFYAGYNILFFMLQYNGAPSKTNYAAHVGGLIVGAFYAFWWKDSHK